MAKITLSEYEDAMKKEREKFFAKPFELVYEQFISIGLDSFPEDYFAENASAIVEELREKSWLAYVPLEKEFTAAMMRKLVTPDDVAQMTAFEAICWFIDEYPEHNYKLALSNTQSRRSRAGKEFEAIIELVLLGAGISIDSQANIGKSLFVEKGLGKLVDIVSPGIVEYVNNKRNTLLISAKTTLRERWQEVPEELGRTGAGEMLLVTLDETVSATVLEQLYEQNIQLVTTKSVRDKFYSENSRVLSFEEMIAELKRNGDYWAVKNYSESDIAAVELLIEKQLKKHGHHRFVYEKYLARKNNL